MAIVTYDWTETFPASVCGGALSIGNFDGVHRGHLALLEALRQQAAAIAGPAIVLTFDPHPLQLLRPEKFQPVLTSVPQRAELLAESGADHVIILRTTAALLSLSARQFFERLIRERVSARALVEGVNFGFGRNREGNVDTLAGLCRSAQIGLAVVPPFKWAGVVVSSSRVRDALLLGDARQAAEFLSRPYRLKGTVGVGAGRGRKLGFPTANLHAVETLVPRDGVYAVRVHHGTRQWPGALNIGPNVTFGEEVRKIEVHLIGFRGELTGQSLALDFIERLRDTRQFAGAADLVEQIRLDVASAQRAVS
jgi:riboflavin kinase/FMN adenylyltransferase